MVRILDRTSAMLVRTSAFKCDDLFSLDIRISTTAYKYLT